MFISQILTAIYIFSKKYPLLFNISDSFKSLITSHLKIFEKATGYTIYILFIINTLRDLLLKSNGLRFLGVANFAPIYQRLTKKATGCHIFCLMCARDLPIPFFLYMSPLDRKYPLPVAFYPNCLTVSDLKSNGLNRLSVAFCLILYKFMLSNYLIMELPLPFRFALNVNISTIYEKSEKHEK